MNRPPLVICGLTPFAGMVAHYFQSFSPYEVVAFAAHERFIHDPEFEGRPVVAIERLPDRFQTSEVRFFAAIEYKWLNSARRQVVEALQTLGFRPASFVHPASSVCSTAQIGDHCFLMEGITVGYRSALGSNVIVHPRTHIGHHAQVGNHNYLCAGTHIDRGAVVGEYCHLGPGTIVAGSGRIGDWCYTRPRQEVTSAISSGTTFNPALRAPGRVIDRRSPKALSSPTPSP